jgi:hypothetical protein
LLHPGLTIDSPFRRPARSKASAESAKAPRADQLLKRYDDVNTTISRGSSRHRRSEQHSAQQQPMQAIAAQTSLTAPA